MKRRNLMKSFVVAGMLAAVGACAQVDDGGDIVDIAALRANKRETIEWLKFTLEGAGERTHGYAFEDPAF